MNITLVHGNTNTWFQQVEELQFERDELTRERDKATCDRDALIIERDALRVEKESLKQELENRSNIIHHMQEHLVSVTEGRDMQAMAGGGYVSLAPQNPLSVPRLSTKDFCTVPDWTCKTYHVPD